MWWQLRRIKALQDKAPKLLCEFHYLNLLVKELLSFATKAHVLPLKYFNMKSRDNMMGLVLSLESVEVWDQTQVVRLGSKYPYHLGHS